MAVTSIQCHDIGSSYRVIVYSHFGIEWCASSGSLERKEQLMADSQSLNCSLAFPHY